MNAAHGTPQVADEQIITIFHLALQVYCSPSLKEYLHNPVMPLLACNIERKESILCAHGGVCGHMGVWWLYVHTHQCVNLCQCHQNSGNKSTSVCTCISNHTSKCSYKHLTIAHYFLYMFTADKCDVTVTYVYIGLAHTSFHVPFSTLAIGRYPHNETSTTVGEGHVRGQVLVRYTKCCRRICIQA